MSFVRVGRTQSGQGKRPPARSKKTGAPKREWVSTVNDLSVHKLTPEELSRRHEIHRSQNRVVAQWELRERALRRHWKHTHRGSPAPLDPTSISIIREVFSEQLQLQDVLARSDRAMAVVKDLFGDAPRRHTGFPSVTMAPDCVSDSELPVLQKPDPPTQLSLLSQSLMDTQALNEVEHSEDDGNEEKNTHRGSKKKGKSRPQSRKGVQQLKRCRPSSSQQGATGGCPQTPSASGGSPDQAALNATAAVQRLKSVQHQTEQLEPGESSTLVTQVLNADPPLTRFGRTTQSSRVNRGRSADGSGLDGSNLSSLSGNQSSLELLQGLLAQVEADLDGLGPEQPVSGAPEPGPQHSSHSLTGFSVALVSTLGRLASLLRQREEEARKEARERSRLAEEVMEQRGLIDALTAETLALREESAALQAGMQQRTLELEHTVDTVVLALGGLGVLGGDRNYESHDPDSVALGSDGGPLYAEREPQMPAAVYPAVLLSPPRQRDNRRHSSVVRSLSLHQQASLPGPQSDTMGSRHKPQTLSPAPSVTSLPRPSATTSPLDHFPEPNAPSEPSQDAMLAQIAELTRQNSLIRAQLMQSTGQGAGNESPREGYRRGGSTSSTTGRETPLSSLERRVSAPSSTGRVTPKTHAEGDRGPSLGKAEQQLIQQTVASEGPCVGSMEQRLLELNRQSAAARSRLLELIEQQQRSTSARVSPSVSPIPPHSLSPASARGRTPESSVSLPEQDPSPLSSGIGRRSAGEVPPQSLGTETRGARPQVDKMRGDGWFALSTHVR